MGNFDHLVGELQPGDHGWLPLDEAGSPTGPATLDPPPGPDAKACSVFSPIGVGIDKLVSSSGAPLDPPLNSNVDKRPPGHGEGVEEDPPILDSLEPAEAEVGGPDLTLRCLGSGFSAASVIVFNGGDEVTMFVSETELTTGVKPSLVSMSVPVPVQVRNGLQPEAPISAPQTFTFVDPEVLTRRRK